jgi:hypothetical protein
MSSSSFKLEDLSTRVVKLHIFDMDFDVIPHVRICLYGLVFYKPHGHAFRQVFLQLVHLIMVTCCYCCQSQ